MLNPDLTILPSNVIWTTAALVGIVLGIWSIIEAQLDLRTQRAAPTLDYPKILTAKGTVAIETGRLTVQSILFSLGVASAFTPKPVPEHEMLGNILAVASIILVFNSVIGLYVKRKLLAMLTERRVQRQ